MFFLLDLEKRSNKNPISSRDQLTKILQEMADIGKGLLKGLILPTPRAKPT